MEITDSTALSMLDKVYSYNPYNNLQDNNLIDTVNSTFQQNVFFQYQGDIPYYCLWNLEKTKEYILGVDEDSLIGIVADPGLGKSTQSLICASYLDSQFSMKRIIFTFDELLDFLVECSNEIKKEESSLYTSYLRGSSVILDEAVYMLFSADSNTKQGKNAVKLFSVIRFLNLIVFVNITNFDKLNKTIRESRLRLVLRIPEKGEIEFYSKKRVGQIEVTDEGINYPEPNFTERTGLIPHTCSYFLKYKGRKASFVSNSIQEIISEVQK